eukprot:Skav211041  [mRNA]  locus=scaffold1434:222390:227526:- [translate_table: standard]
MALSALVALLESYFDAVQLKLHRLHLIMKGHRNKESPLPSNDDSNTKNMLAQEPISLVDYRHHRSKEEQVELGRTMERHFLGNITSMKGMDIRLHGRWMELSTRAGDDNTSLKGVSFGCTVGGTSSRWRSFLHLIEVQSKESDSTATQVDQKVSFLKLQDSNVPVSNCASIVDRHCA